MITRPSEYTYSGWFGYYINLAAFENLIVGLKEVNADTNATVAHLDENILNFRYEPCKWTIKDILGHLIDTERMFSYRALRFARHDKTPLAGFNQDLYIENGNYNTRTIEDILEEMNLVRANTIKQFSTFAEHMLDHVAEAHGNQGSPRSMGFVIVGHEIHHMAVVKSKYLRHFNVAAH